jgi:hypothetical protein
MYTSVEHISLFYRSQHAVPNTLAYFSLTSNVRLSKNLVTNALAYYAKA